MVVAPLAAGPVVGVKAADWFFHWTPLGRLPEFVLGVALACLVRLTQQHLVRHVRVLWATAIAVSAISYVNTFQAPPVLRYAACTALGFGLIVVAAAASDLRGDRMFCARPAMVRLGELSFAFYLVHLLVIRALAAAEMSGAAAALSALALSLTAAWALHEWIEKPARAALVKSVSRPVRLRRGSPVRLGA